MRKDIYMFGARGEKYGIWNASRKEFQFGICEDTPMLAEARLFQCIGNDARKWRFETKALPAELRKKYADTVEPDPRAMRVECERKDREIKDLHKQIASLQRQLKDARSANA